MGHVRQTSPTAKAFPATAHPFPPVAATSSGGVITWTPTEAQGPSTNIFTTVVTDTNLAAVNAQNVTVTNTFTVFVNESNVAPVLILPPSVATAEWTAIPGAIYRLQYRTNLDDAAWDDLIGDVTASGATASKADATLGTNAVRLYRALVLP